MPMRISILGLMVPAVLCWTSPVAAQSSSATSRPTTPDAPVPGPAVPQAVPQEEGEETEERRDEGAQEPPSEAPEHAVEEAITVVGIADALRDAVDLKRDAPAVIDAIVADDVGKLPDRNVAEALQRVPGVVINRVFGEGERVSLRGLAPNLVRATVNGHNVATGDWFILNQQAATRSFNYLLLPSEMIGQLKVYKSPTAEIDEGGIGGVIDVETRKPLDLGSLHFSGSLQNAYTENSDSNNLNASALFSWKNAADNFGILLSGDLLQRELRRDGVEVLGYLTDAQSGLLVPDLIGSALFQQDRERKGFHAVAQFQPTDRFEVNVNGFFSRLEADNTNHNYLAWTSQALGGGGTLTAETVVGDTAVAGVISSADNGTSGRGVVFDVIDRQSLAETSYADVDGTYTPNDDWILHFDLGYTAAQGDTEEQPFVEFGAPGAFRYDLRGSAPQVEFLNVDPTDPADMVFDFASLHQITTDDDEIYSYLDAERYLNLGSVTSLKFGVKYTQHERKTDFQATTFGGFVGPLIETGCDGGPCTPGDFAGGTTPGDFLDDIGAPGTLDRYWAVDREKLANILFGSFDGTRFTLPPEAFSVTEDTYGGFLMANLEGDWRNWRGNVGVRAVATDQESVGNTENADGEVENPFGNFTPVTAEKDYTDILPSLNFSFDLRDDLVLRAAAARVMARPNYTDIAPRVTLNVGALTGTAGDPEIDPFRANQADLSLEWYHGRNAILSGALFYKDVRSFITDRPIQLRRLIDTNTPNLARCDPAVTPEAPNRFSCLFDINERVNGGGGEIKGVELGLLQPLGGGFGVQVNYTYSDADADDPGLEIPGNSEHSGNIVGFYENSRFALRLAYNYRSEFFDTFDRSTRLNQEELESLDASLAYNLTRNLILTLDGVNLTDEEVRQFASDEFRPRSVLDNGRYFFAGVRFRY